MNPITLEEKPFSISQSTQSSNRYDVYLSKPIGSVHEYEELFTLLSTVTEADVVYMHINCPGGSVDTGLQIIAFMRDCRATIITATYGTTASMGTAIFLSGDQFIVSKHCRVMIHNFSGGAYGKGHELKAEIASTSAWVEKAFYDIHVPFLTEQEYDNIVSGSDMWLLGDELEERLNRMIEYREELYAEQELEYKIGIIKELLNDLTGCDDNEELSNLKQEIEQQFGHLTATVEQAAPVQKVKTKKVSTPSSTSSRFSTSYRRFNR